MLRSFAFFDKNEKIILNTSEYHYDSRSEGLIKRTVVLNNNERVVGMKWKVFDRLEMYEIQ